MGCTCFRCTSFLLVPLRGCTCLKCTIQLFCTTCFFICTTSFVGALETSAPPEGTCLECHLWEPIPSNLR